MTQFQAISSSSSSINLLFTHASRTDSSQTLAASLHLRQLGVKASEFHGHSIAHCNNSNLAFARKNKCAIQAVLASDKEAITNTEEKVLRKKLNKVVLAYSGGLDTSVIVPWLRENYGCEVVCFTADVGQGIKELEGLEEG